MSLPIDTIAVVAVGVAIGLVLGFVFTVGVIKSLIATMVASLFDNLSQQDGQEDFDPQCSICPFSDDDEIDDNVIDIEKPIDPYILKSNPNDPDKDKTTFNMNVSIKEYIKSKGYEEEDLEGQK